MDLRSTPPRTVAERRGYQVTEVAHARSVARTQLSEWELPDSLTFGLPEIDDRYHVWRVPVIGFDGKGIGEVVIDARTGVVDIDKSSSLEAVLSRLSGLANSTSYSTPSYDPSIALQGQHAILHGDSEVTLRRLPSESIGLVFTSPPYYNARPDYADFESYDAYLAKMGRVIRECFRVLGEGRFLVMNVAPVLVRRKSRSESSTRLAVPFDMHRILVEAGFDFIDDIIWEKPSGAGWATGRGRRFAADRQPLQYKAVPVTEYVLVYRKHTDKLIDWNIRTHPDQGAVERSKISDDYEATNVWRIKPAHSKHHPAIFPLELAERVLKYYSFIGDTVLDPFAGVGTVGEAAVKWERQFVLSEIDPDYVDTIKNMTLRWLGKDALSVLCVGTDPIMTDELLL
jgi:DNA modification methylase